MQPKHWPQPSPVPYGRPLTYKENCDRLQGADQQYKEVLVTLANMGYTNFESNLIRVRKFTEDHINNVITDYLQNPSDAEPE
jgi:hypothetical protein